MRSTAWNAPATLRAADVIVPPELGSLMVSLVDEYDAARKAELEAKASKTILSARLRDVLLQIDPELPDFGARVMLAGKRVAVVKHSPRGVVPARAKKWAEEHPEEAEPFMVTTTALDYRALLDTSVPDHYDLLKRVGYYFG